MSAKSKTSLTARQRAETLRRVMQWDRPYGLSVGGSKAAAALSVAAQLYIPILCGRAIDQMFGPGQVDLPGVVRIALQVAFAAAAAALAQWLLSLFNNHIAFSVSRGRWICQGSCALPCRWLLRRLQRPWHNGF